MGSSKNGEGTRRRAYDQGTVTEEEDAMWLADKLVAIERGVEVSVVTEVDGKLVAKSGGFAKTLGG